MAGAGPGALRVLQADDSAHRVAHCGVDLGLDRGGGAVRRPGATRSMDKNMENQGETEMAMERERKGKQCVYIYMGAVRKSR